MCGNVENLKNSKKKLFCFPAVFLQLGTGSMSGSVSASSYRIQESFHHAYPGRTCTNIALKFKTFPMVVTCKRQTYLYILYRCDRFLSISGSGTPSI